MKKALAFYFMLFCSLTLMAQKVKPVIIAKPSVTFLKSLEQKAQSISAKSLKGLNEKEKSFVALLKTANTASAWDKAAYKIFIRKATPLIKAMGIMSDPDDGSEIFSDPDDGGEIFASSKLITKAFNKF
jgi:hypothetical protein